jgi:hypothetical protein
VSGRVIPCFERFLLSVSIGMLCNLVCRFVSPTFLCARGGKGSERKYKESARQVHARDTTLTTTLYLPFSHLFPLIPSAPFFSSNKLNHLSTLTKQPIS